MLNPDSPQELDLTDMESNVNIPVLDKPVDPAEVDYVIKHQVKLNKGCGPDGLCPGIFKLLPVQWIMFLTVLFLVLTYCIIVIQKIGTLSDFTFYLKRE